MNRFLGSLAAAILAGSLFVLPAGACMFHTSLPELTITDELRRADAIVLARDNGKYEFEAVEAFRGDLDYFEIPFLADTSTVQRLKLNP